VDHGREMDQQVRVVDGAMQGFKWIGCGGP